MITAKLLADSMSPSGARLRTFEATYPLIIHNELMTHGVLAKSSASSRAIPVAKMIQRVQEDPFVPCYIGANQKGMVAGEELPEDVRQKALNAWSNARDAMVGYATDMSNAGVHKQISNRLLNPFQWMTTIVSGTDFDNFYGLRCHPAAEPHLQELAYKMQEVQCASTPRMLQQGEWHLPFIFDEDREVAEKLVFAEDLNLFLAKVSVGRCARISYLTHDGKRDLMEDVALHDRLLGSTPKHASPAEHVAMALDFPVWFKHMHDVPVDGVYGLRNQVADIQDLDGDRYPGLKRMHQSAALIQLTSGKFLGFKQYRKTLVGENIGSRAL